MREIQITDFGKKNITKYIGKKLKYLLKKSINPRYGTYTEASFVVGEFLEYERKNLNIGNNWIHESEISELYCIEKEIKEIE